MCSEASIAGVTETEPGAPGPLYQDVPLNHWNREPLVVCLARLRWIGGVAMVAIYTGILILLFLGFTLVRYICNQIKKRQDTRQP